MINTKHPDGHILQAFHDNELQGTVSNEVAVHCETCEVCSAVLSDLMRVKQLVVQSPEPVMPRSVWQSVRPAREQKTFMRPVFAMTACAAGIVLGVLLGPIQISPNNNDTEGAWSDSVTLWSQQSEPLLSTVFYTGTE